MRVRSTKYGVRSTRRRLSVLRTPYFVLLVLATLGLAADQRSTTVGMPGRIEQIVLPGTELEAKPLADPKSPVVLRIVGVWPHGIAFRYDLEYYALAPGRHDLRNYLRRKDGSSTADLPPLIVDVQPVLPPGQMKPNALELKGTPHLGGYWLALTAGGVLWLIGLLAILFVRRRRTTTEAKVVTRPLTVADRLRPLVESALAGRLSTTQRAELERTLLAFWRKRLRLENVRPIEAMARLRAHPEAGELLGQLEMWLHRPGLAPEVDVTALLRPYQAAKPAGTT